MEVCFQLVKTSGKRKLRCATEDSKFKAAPSFSHLRLPFSTSQVTPKTVLKTMQ